MPPPDSKLTLSEKEKSLLDQWIEEGAKYDKHWAFVPPVSPKTPKTKTDWGCNPIDAFILENLEKNKLQPSKEVNVPRYKRKHNNSPRVVPHTLRNRTHRSTNRRVPNRWRFVPKGTRSTSNMTKIVREGTDATEC